MPESSCQLELHFFLLLYSMSSVISRQRGDLEQNGVNIRVADHTMSLLKLIGMMEKKIYRNK